MRKIIDRKRVTAPNTILPTVTDQMLDKLFENFYNWANTNITDDSLKKISGISHKTIKRTLSQKNKNISWSTLKSIVDTYSVSIDHIFGLDEIILPYTISSERYALAMVITGYERILPFIICDILEEYEEIMENDLLSCTSPFTIPGFARRLNMVRTEKNIPLSSLAESIGVKDLSLVSKQRLNSQGVRVKRLLSFSLALNVSIDFLVGHKPSVFTDDPLMDNYHILCNLPTSSIKNYTNKLKIFLEK